MHGFTIPSCLRPGPGALGAAPHAPPMRSPQEGGAEPLARRRGGDGEEALTGSALDWALRKADASLDEIEDNPPAYARALYDLSTGPVGAAASRGVATAAKVTVQVGGEALKAAAPVGRWVVTQTFKLAAGAVARGLGGGGGKGGGGGSQK